LPKLGGSKKGKWLQRLALLWVSDSHCSRYRRVIVWRQVWRGASARLYALLRTAGLLQRSGVVFWLLEIFFSSCAYNRL